MGQTVKTAISLRRDLFEQAETLAEELHVSRSRLFAVALENFMRRRRNRRLLDDINAAHNEESDRAERAVRKHMRRHHRKLASEGE